MEAGNLPGNLKITEYDFSKESKIKDGLLKKCLSKLEAAKDKPALDRDIIELFSNTRKLDDDELEMLAAAGEENTGTECPFANLKCYSCGNGTPYYNSKSSTTPDSYSCSAGYKKTGGGA
jgi:hypothetical protein